MDILNVANSALEGCVAVSGAKNSSLKLLAASILTADSIMLKNYPSTLLDARTHVGMLEVLGKSCTLINSETILIEEKDGLQSVLSWDDRSIRNTLLVLGALTARTGAGAVPLPGGCKLGERTYDFHEMLLKAMGARVWEEGGLLKAEAPSGGLVGAEIHLPVRSTGATENAILAGTLARGTTHIWNPHIRPEVFDLIGMLNAMGAKISVYGQEHIEVDGVDGLTGTAHRVIADSMEAITWLIASVMTKGDVEIQHFPYGSLEVALIHLRESGARFFCGENSLIVRGGTCYPIEISTGPHPGINSDVQPIMAAYAACARGESKIVDLRFPGRYGYAHEMAKLGVAFSVRDNLLTIFGNGGHLTGAEVRAPDLRAGVALALCGLVADGQTVIRDAWQIERGYNRFTDKLALLGGRIEVF